MSEPEPISLSSRPSATPQPPSRGPRSRLRRFFLRHLPLTLGGGAVLLMLALVCLYFVASSEAFQNGVRNRLVREIANATGGRVEMQSFHWRLLHLEAEADGLVIHGLEDPGDAPYARIQRLRVRCSILGFFSPRILLRDFEADGPRLHLIVYPDGSTNQPHPHRRLAQGRPVVDQLFDLRARHVEVEQGMLDWDDRAAAFDYQNRYAPLDFTANDVTLGLSYMPATWGAPEHYRVEAAASDLNLARNLPHAKALAVHGTVQATLDLERQRVLVRNLRIAAQSDETKEHALEVAGDLEGFTHPTWHAKVDGDLDMRLLDPLTGYSDAPEGIARLNLSAQGSGAEFGIDGGVHVDDGAYIGTGVEARGVTLDARVHADSSQLLITEIVARLRQGGQIEGAVALQPWLPPATAKPAQITAEGNEPYRAGRNVLVRRPIPDIDVNGKVTANFKDVALDTILDMVSTPAYRRLGVAARLNGSAIATWSQGDSDTVKVNTLLNLSPSRQAPDGEAPATGVIDGSYAQRNGRVDLQRLEVHLPASDLEAHGTIGAYPITSSSALSVDLHSHDLGEFDAALRSLGLEREGRSGAAALPVALAGQADFEGTWTGSLAKPHIAGDLKATQLALEMPKPSGVSGQSQYVRMDSVEVTGSYSATQIGIERAQLVRGRSSISLRGTLDASPGARPQFDSNSVLHVRLQASHLDASDVQPLLAANLPVTGVFDTEIQADGALHEPSGSGWLSMAKGSVYGEPVSDLRIDGAVAERVMKLRSVTLREWGGSVSASGSYDLRTRAFQLDAQGAGIDLAQIRWLGEQNLEAAGTVSLDVSGSGALDDPHLEGKATVASLAVAGQRFNETTFTAHSAGHVLNYNLTTQTAGAEMALHGETELAGGYTTHAQLEFAHFNIGAILRTAHIEAVSGNSALAGTVTLDGPLQHPEQLRGDARLREMAVTIAGVPLDSEGGMHVTLANNRIELDPLHVTGESTDLRVHGGLSLSGSRQLDLAANGSINLKLAESLDPDLTASGLTTFTMEAHGPLQHPAMQGRIEFQNGSLALEDLANGLSQLHGTLEFNQNRLEVRSLTAMTGGGLLSVGGSLSYQHGIFADLTVTGNGVRIRYPEGVTSLADARLHLQGAQNNLLLSGDVQITRFYASPDLDLASLAAQAGTAVQSVAAPEAPSNHVRLDVHVVSSPQLNFQNAYAKLAGDVDLHLRGTLASPSLLGRVSVTEGSALIAGTRYDLERGDISFTNPVRIEPIIDLSATAHVEDYDVFLDLHGSPQKMSVTYRSDPPLPEADVVSLLALGHTSNQQRLYTQQQEQSISNPTTDALLGGALNATVSNRIQKLFGAGSVKLDPNYLGAFGNSTTRITVEEQFGRTVVLTYATDINTTNEQLLQAEVAINRHVSVVVARDESGVFSMVIKFTRRYP